MIQGTRTRLRAIPVIRQARRWYRSTYDVRFPLAHLMRTVGCTVSEIPSVGAARQRLHFTRRA